MLDRYRQEIEKQLPAGTQSDVVEKYFRDNGIVYVYETIEELTATHMLELIEQQIRRIEPGDVEGIYTATIDDVGKAFFGPYSIRVYVVMDSHNSVFRTHLRGVSTGP